MRISKIWRVAVAASRISLGDCDCSPSWSGRSSGDVFRVQAHSAIGKPGSLSASLKRLLRVLGVVFLLCCDIAAHADEIAPLGDNKQNLKGLLQEREEFMVGPPYPELLKYRFTKIRPAIDGISRLARLGLADEDADRREFLDLVDRVLKARLSELGVEDQIEILPPFIDPRPAEKSCDTLNATVILAPYESRIDDKPVVAVIVNLVVWQSETTKQADGSVTCRTDVTPPSQLDATRVFLVDRNDRDDADGQLRQTLLGFIDRNILRRVIAMNRDALDAVKSWVK